MVCVDRGRTRGIMAGGCFDFGDGGRASVTVASGCLCRAHAPDYYGVGVVISFAVFTARIVARTGCEKLGFVVKPL